MIERVWSICNNLKGDILRGMVLGTPISSLSGVFNIFDSSLASDPMSTPIVTMLWSIDKFKFSQASS